MRCIISFLLFITLAGCASTGVVPMGQNQYSISKTSPACGFRDAGGVRADLYREMSGFCATKNLYPEVVTIEALDGIIGRRCASATIEFRCVLAALSENIVPKGRRPDRDMNRHPAVPADRGQFATNPSESRRVNQDDQRFATNDVYSELTKLKQLLDAGIITQEEFDSRKKVILAR